MLAILGHRAIKCSTTTEVGLDSGPASRKWTSRRQLVELGDPRQTPGMGRLATTRVNSHYRKRSPSHVRCGLAVVSSPMGCTRLLRVVSYQNGLPTIRFSLLNRRGGTAILLVRQKLMVLTGSTKVTAAPRARSYPGSVWRPL